MKAISEMTEDEVRDYALQLVNDIDSKDKELDDLKASNEELTTLNKALQRRNNELFTQVEQTSRGSSLQGTEEPTEEPEVVSCEDFAKNLKL